MSDIYAWTSTGRRLHVDLADERAHALVAADGDLNPRSMQLWRRVLAATDWELVVDVGVNYGEMLVGVDLPPSARVVGFEPNARVRALAERTFADNGLHVDLRPDAVGARSGTASFAVDPHWSGLSSLTGGAAGAPDVEAIEVAVTTLDAVVGADVGSFAVKVDVEGYEADVLAGAAGLLARPVPWALMLEVLHMPAGQLAALAGGHPLLMLGEHGLVRVAPEDADAALASDAVYGQDAVLVSDAALALLLPAGR